MDKEQQNVIGFGLGDFVFSGQNLVMVVDFVHVP
jgi:hypothetical protein